MNLTADPGGWNAQTAREAAWRERWESDGGISATLRVRHPYPALVWMMMLQWHPYEHVTLEEVARYAGPWLTQGQIKWSMGQLVLAGLAERHYEQNRRLVFRLTPLNDAAIQEAAEPMCVLDALAAE